MANLELLPADGTLALSLMAWLLTYAVHSTLLGAVAWFSTFLFNGHALRETLWKAALIGGVLTTTLQMGLGVEPLSGRMVLPAAMERPAAAATGEPSKPQILPGEPAPANAAAQSFAAARTATPPGDARLHATEIQLLKGASGIQSFSLTWGHLLLLAWLSGAAFALARMMVIRRRFLAGLEPRCLVKDGALQESLRQLRRRSGFTRPVRLTRSDHLTSPVALGRDEICLPTRALIELNRPQQEGMLAHELAHLRRRDPLWLVVSGVIESIFFFQPFNRIGRQHLQESTEFLCDDWAVRQTGRSMTLARSLAQVASWLERQPQPAVLAPMARLGSPLLRRIQHLVEDRPPLARPGRMRFAVALLPLLAVASLAPAVSGSSSTSPASAPVVAGSGTGSVAAAPVAPAASGSGTHHDAPSVLRIHGTSRSVHEEDDRLSSIEVVGDVTFARDMSGIESMAPGTTLTIRNRQGDREQVLRVDADSNGLPLYDYQVNGREEPFEPGGRLFMQESLQATRQQRAEADARRAQADALRLQADARRAEMADRRDEIQQQRRQAREFERQQNLQMNQAREEARRAMSLMESEARQENRAQVMAYQEAQRAQERAMRQQDRQNRGQIQSLRMETRQQVADLYLQAEEAMRRAERTEGADQAEALAAAREALHQARETSTRMHEELIRQEKELAQESMANRLRNQEELERMQQQAEEFAMQAQEQRRQLLQERKQSLELMKREMEQQRRQMMRQLEEDSRRQLEEAEPPAILSRVPPAPPAHGSIPAAPTPPAPVSPAFPPADGADAEAPPARQ